MDAGRAVWRGGMAWVGVVALAALLLVPAAPVRAETSVAAPWPSVEVEPGSEVTIPLEVDASPRQRVDLEVVEVPDGWEAILRGGGFTVRAITPGADEAGEVELEVRVPADAPEGIGRVSVQATGADGSDDRFDVDLVVAEEIVGAVTLDTEFPELTGAADDGFRWTLELDNSLPGETTFTITRSAPPGWIVTARPAGEAQATTVTLEGGDATTIDVEAEPPANVEAGRYGFEVVVSGGGQRLSQELVAEVEGVTGIELGTEDERLNASGSSGQATRVPLLVTNTGSSPLTDVTLEADPPAGWEVGFDPEEVPPIPAGDSATVTALITPADEAIAGDYALGFEVDADGRTDAIEVRYQVRTPMSWGAVAIGLIGAALAGLGYVFRRFGRR